jgi:hypothetical protein
VTLAVGIDELGADQARDGRAEGEREHADRVGGQARRKRLVDDGDAPQWPPVLAHPASLPRRGSAATAGGAIGGRAGSSAAITARGSWSPISSRLADMVYRP